MARTHPLSVLEALVTVGIGGFAGSNLRYFVDLVLPSLGATLTVNVLGCLALGFLLYEEIYGGAISRPGRTILATGFISSFTTYSTFVLDAVTATPLLAIAYLGGSYALGFTAILVGRETARFVTENTPVITEELG